MRRIAASLLIPLVAGAALVGCGSSSPSGSASGNANSAVTVSGTFNHTPTVKIPHEKPTAKLYYSTPIKGSGGAIASGDLALANVAIYKWSGKTSTLLDSTYTSGPQLIPATLPLSGLTTALKGASIGSRIVAVLPPKYAYGTQGNSSLNVKGTDTLVWVIDLLQQFAPGQSVSGSQTSNGGGALPTVTTKAGSAPVVTIPKKSPPTKLSVTTLIKGNGAELQEGDTVVAQYVGVNWRTGKVFSASWPSSSQPSGQPFSFQLGGQVITGWNDGLPGTTVGSRVMLVIPPSLGYGPSGGQASAGIKKNDSLVFVIDILGVQGPSS